MKHLKRYESKQEPQIGDYVICTTSFPFEDTLENFLCKNIGVILAIEKDSDGYDSYTVDFEDIPQEIINDFNTPLTFDLNEIVYFSKDKEDVEIFLLTKKYNL